MKKSLTLLSLLATALLGGCAAHQGSGFKGEYNPFRPLDDIQSIKGLTDPASDGDSGYFSDNPKDYIDENGVGTGIPTRFKRGVIISPWAPKKGLVDARYYEEGDIITCPYTGKPLRVPKDKEYKAVDVTP